jgi:exonuclease-1
MSWLHKGVFACDVKALAKSQRGLSSDKPTSSTASSSVDMKCVNFTMKKAETLRSNFGIEVILVIDGDSLPGKKEENELRRAERHEAFQKALTAEQAGDSRAARRFYAQSCSVTHKIKYELIKACKQAGIAFLVAPYEADAQMARMAHTGMVDLVITEDSDTLVYGCPRVLFKVDFETNQGQEIQIMRDLGKNDSPSFKNWTHDMFVFMCILSGCDYCKGIPGIGIKLAHKIVRVHRTPSKIFSALRKAGRMTQEFEDKFWIAFRTFRHQRVYCPSKQQIETLWPIVGSNHHATPNEVWPFLGAHIDSKVASKIADGTLHPATKTDWSSALRQESSSSDVFKQSTSNYYNVGDIHHRNRERKNDNRRRDHRSAVNEKENIWHSLVYGGSNERGGGRDDAPSANEGNPHHKQDDDEPAKNDMFSFFPRDKTTKAKKRGRDDSNSGDVRPPLTEIYLGGLDSGNSTSSSSKKGKSTYVPPATHKDVPIHFHEYSSRLVGKSFKPMARKRLKKGANFGSKSSQAVQKIWERSNKSSQRMSREAITKATTQPTADEHDNDRAKQDEGVSIFQKAALPHPPGPDDGLISGKEYEGGWDQHLYADSYQVSFTYQPSSSSLYYEHPSSSFIYDIDGHHLVQSDCSLTGAFTTVTAEPQDLFSSTARNECDAEVTTATATNYDQSFGWEDTSKRGLFQPQTTAPSLFDAANSSSYDPQMGFESSGQFEDCAYVDGHDEEDFFVNFNLPSTNDNGEKEEYFSQIDGDLLSELILLQQL